MREGEGTGGGGMSRLYPSWFLAIDRQPTDPYFTLPILILGCRSIDGPSILISRRRFLFRASDRSTAHPSLFFFVDSYFGLSIDIRLVDPYFAPSIDPRPIHPYFSPPILILVCRSIYGSSILILRHPILIGAVLF